MSDFIWRPSDAVVEAANITRFMRRHDIADYDALLRRSHEDVAWFWEAALDDLGVKWRQPYDLIMDESRGFPWTQWFLGGELNLVDNCLDRHAESAAAADRPALIWEEEGGRAGSWTFAELSQRSAQVAEGLAGLGVGEGDRVALYMPMAADLVATFFGCLKIGAVVVPVFSAFGAPALATRLRDAEVKILVTADGTRRRGKVDRIKDRADEALADAPGVAHVLVKRHAGVEVAHGERDLDFDEVVDRQPGTMRTVALPAEARSLIIFTSGTTGKPKGTVHTHGGCLAQMAKELAYNFDVKAGERFFWLSDIGWMMGPWELIGALFHGAAVMIYDGAPNFPDPGRVWSMIARHRLTHLGISPTAIRVLMQADAKFVDDHDLSSLRLLGSTGEPWDEASYHWFFERIGGGRLPVINISGGTEIVGCLLAPLPIAPLKACALQGPGLGMAVDVFDDEGNSVRGGIGHLVCKRPAPSMTKGFLNDPQRYLDTYFARFGDGIWYHGDWAKVDADGQWFLHGRSDDTLNIAGKRIGPAEFEAALITHEAVAEACAFGVPHDIKGTVAICFAVLTEGHTGSDELAQALRDLVGDRLGKPLRPDVIRFVPALPKTRSAKIVRGMVRRRYLGEPIGDTASLANPEALEAIEPAGD